MWESQTCAQDQLQKFQKQKSSSIILFTLFVIFCYRENVVEARSEEYQMFMWQLK